MNTLKDRISKAFAAARVANPEISKTTLWKACGISSGAVTQWFNGGTTEIKGENARIVAEILGVNRDWLANGSGSMYKGIAGHGPAALALAGKSTPEPPSNQYKPEDVLALFSRLIALQAGLVAVIRTIPYTPNLPPVLEQEFEKARMALADAPNSADYLEAFDSQAAMIRLSADTHHS